MIKPSATSRFYSALCRVVFISSLLFLCIAAGDEEHYYLDENSVVLITGAAGFIGSELAMALHRTYNPKEIICVDSMDNGFGVRPSAASSDAHRTELELASLEYKRQRVFHLLQTVGVKAHFYRVDFRPSIPEYFDSSEVPLLDRIFQAHPEITHVVHMADNRKVDDPYYPVIPRVKAQPKAGMMEALLEQMRKIPSDKRPHFVYASSSEVYNYIHPTATHDDINPPPFREDRPLTAASTLAGASKLIDELLAQTYFQTDKIFSIGLRFFSVYGPWGVPGSVSFEMAEKVVVGGDEAKIVTPNDQNHVRDYVYIDDAVNAIMTAMQLLPITEDGAPPPPLVINVGSGKPVSTRSLANQLMDLAGVEREDDQEDEDVDETANAATISYASTERAQELLGFEASVTLEQGLETTLAWHYDRAYPYGGKHIHGEPKDDDEQAKGLGLESKGIVSCSRYDAECLRGTPVFPCASECSHEKQCISSFYDDVIDFTRYLTAACEAVMYTVALDDDLSIMLSAVTRVSTQSKPSVESSRGHFCNIAFVSDKSPLVKRLSAQRNAKNKKAVMTHGFWALVPVYKTSHAADKESFLRLLPKLSPGLFFGGITKKAIYCDPDVIFDSVPRLLEEANTQPYHEEIQGATAILIGKRPPTGSVAAATTSSTNEADQVQNRAYRMIQMAAIEEMAGTAFAQLVDSSFVVHSLNNEDARLFRCDVFGEVVQWNVTTDTAAFEFITGLHDMWSRVISRKLGHEPWWIEDDVETVRSTITSRRLTEASSPKADLSSRSMPLGRRLQEAMAEDSEDEEDGQPKGHPGPDDAEDAVEHNGFGAYDAIRSVIRRGYSIERKARPDSESGDGTDDFLEDDVLPKPRTVDSRDQEGEEGGVVPNVPRDPSSYDMWMGILSSTTVRYFSRIVEMDAVGAVHVQQHQVNF